MWLEQSWLTHGHGCVGSLGHAATAHMVVAMLRLSRVVAVPGLAGRSGFPGICLGEGGLGMELGRRNSDGGRE